MKRPNFNEKTEVKVVDPESTFYAKRGKVDRVVGLDANGWEVPKPYSPDNYPSSWMVDVKIDGEMYSFFNWESQLEPMQHKFIDIDYIREEDLVIGKKEDGTDAIRPKNTGAFEPGDKIQISTKIDGANASIAWDDTTGKLEIFSRTNLLNSPGSLRGFYDYVKTNICQDPAYWSIPTFHDIVVFGEWCVSHTVKYNNDWYNKWRVYDIWDKGQNRYWQQCEVKSFCKQMGLEYIEELYYGPFISWEHCRSFIGKSKAYGPEQEGIVVKNQDALVKAALGVEVNGPIYIKIVDEKFKEHMHSKKKEKKPVDLEAEAAKQKAASLAEAVVTEARVRKMVLKLIDEGKLPAELKPTDMGNVMKQLPKLIFEDVMKEEPGTVKLMAENAGKSIAAVTAKLARKIVVGS